MGKKEKYEEYNGLFHNGTDYAVYHMDRKEIVIGGRGWKGPRWEKEKGKNGTGSDFGGSDRREAQRVKRMNGNKQQPWGVGGGETL